MMRRGPLPSHTFFVIITRLLLFGLLMAIVALARAAPAPKSYEIDIGLVRTSDYEGEWELHWSDTLYKLHLKSDGTYHCTYHPEIGHWSGKWRVERKFLWVDEAYFANGDEKPQRSTAWSISFSSAEKRNNTVRLLGGDGMYGSWSVPVKMVRKR